MNCGVGLRHSLYLMLLWLRCRLPSVVLVGPLAWEPPYAAGVALKTKANKQTKKDLLGGIGSRDLWGLNSPEICQPEPRRAEGLSFSLVWRQETNILTQNHQAGTKFSLLSLCSVHPSKPIHTGRASCIPQSANSRVSTSRTPLTDTFRATLNHPSIPDRSAPSLIPRACTQIGTMWVWGSQRALPQRELSHVSVSEAARRKEKPPHLPEAQLIRQGGTQSWSGNCLVQAASPAGMLCLRAASSWLLESAFPTSFLSPVTCSVGAGPLLSLEPHSPVRASVLPSPCPARGQPLCHPWLKMDGTFRQGSEEMKHPWGCRFDPWPPSVG